VARVLIVEDDQQLREVLATIFNGYGYDVTTAPTGEAGLSSARRCPPDLVVLDLLLPGIDGFEVIRRLRTHSRAKVLALSALQDSADKARTLDAGADDYLAKPFDTTELLARLRALLRRTEPEPSDKIIRVHDVEIDLARELVTRDGKALDLTPSEYRLLELLISKRGSTLRHEQITHELWGPGSTHDRANIRIFVQHLRAKLGDASHEPHLIENQHGRGYRWIGGTTKINTPPVQTPA
jgi:two-component system KDP operon response regulator KdpE